MKEEELIKEFKIRMAGILGKEGKFAMNSMIKALEEALQSHDQDLLKKIEGLPNVVIKTKKGNLETKIEVRAKFTKAIKKLIN